MDGSVSVLLDDSFRNEDRILEVVAIPRHECDQHVLPERQLSEIRRRTVGKNVATSDLIAGFHQRRLIDTGVLIRTRVLRQRVDIDARLSRHGLVVVYPHDDARSVNRVDGSTTLGDHGDAGVDGHRALHAGTDQGLLGDQRGHGLALHV